LDADGVRKAKSRHPGTELLIHTIGGIGQNGAGATPAACAARI
jgi:hypothetical protein